MRRHLETNKHQAVRTKLRMTAHQQSALLGSSLRMDASNIPELDTLKQIIPKQKGKHQCLETSEVGALKEEVAALQSQILAIRTATDQEAKERAETSELRLLKGQIAELKAQVAATGVQKKQFERPSRQSDDSRESFDSRAIGVGNGRQKYPEVRSIRPRPWYCFRCGDDGHLAINCENAPNPSRVEEKRRKLRAKQTEWDLQNGLAAEPLN